MAKKDNEKKIKEEVQVEEPKPEKTEEEIKEEVQVEEPKPEKTEEEIKAFREKVESIGMTKGKLSNTRKLASGTIIKRN